MRHVRVLAVSVVAGLALAAPSGALAVKQMIAVQKHAGVQGLPDDPHRRQGHGQAGESPRQDQRDDVQGERNSHLLVPGGCECPRGGQQPRLGDAPAERRHAEGSERRRLDGARNVRPWDAPLRPERSAQHSELHRRHQGDAPRDARRRLDDLLADPQRRQSVHATHFRRHDSGDHGESGLRSRRRPPSATTTRSSALRVGLRRAAGTRVSRPESPSLRRSARPPSASSTCRPRHRSPRRSARFT